jgi:hypothetical protein
MCIACLACVPATLFQKTSANAASKLPLTISLRGGFESTRFAPLALEFRSLCDRTRPYSARIQCPTIYSSRSHSSRSVHNRIDESQNPKKSLRTSRSISPFERRNTGVENNESSTNGRSAQTSLRSLRWKLPDFRIPKSWISKPSFLFKRMIDLRGK